MHLPGALPPQRGVCGIPLPTPVYRSAQTSRLNQTGRPVVLPAGTATVTEGPGSSRARLVPLGSEISSSSSSSQENRMEQ